MFCPDLKIIAMSGGGKVSADNYLEIARIFGASRVITKPFTKKEMVSAVQELMQGGSEGNDPFPGNRGPAN